MFCTTCGNQLTPGVDFCPNCGAAAIRPTTAVQMPMDISTYLIQSILVTLCCCLPFGIVAIVYAAQVSTKLAAGDLAGAQDSANKAKFWCWLGFGLGLLGILGYGFFAGLSFMGPHH